MAGRKTFAVNSRTGLNVREKPSRAARVLRVLADGEKVALEKNAAAPAGWKALQGGGFVMAEYLK